MGGAMNETPTREVGRSALFADFFGKPLIQSSAFLAFYYIVKG